MPPLQSVKSVNALNRIVGADAHIRPPDFHTQKRGGNQPPLSLFHDGAVGVEQGELLQVDQVFPVLGVTLG